jgi:hypothetical protein
VKKYILFSLLLLFATNAASWGIDVPSWSGVDATSSDLPPEGVYIAPSGSMEYSDIEVEVILESLYLYPDTSDVLRESDGDDELETFDCQLRVTQTFPEAGPILLTGPVQTRTTDRELSATGLFATEIVSMSLSGSTTAGTIMIRQDPERTSTGETDITDIGGGLYHIDSFFDVFTELSVDQGSNWMDCDASTHFFLTPEPATLALFGLGALALLRKRRA